MLVLLFHVSHTNYIDENVVKKAYDFALKAHEGQLRKSGEPYFVHVFETAKILAKFGMDVQTIVAGLLHDVLEDTKTSEEEMNQVKKFDLVTGEDIMSTLKIEASPRVGEIKDKLEQAYLDGKINTRADALNEMEKYR